MTKKELKRIESKVFSVSVVIPSFNGEKILKKNLPSLIKAKSNSRNNIKEIIIVDDGSEDGSVAFLRDNYRNIKLLENKINKGFSISVNKGARIAKGDLLLLINIDVIPTHDFLEPVFKHFEDEKVFAVSLHEKNYGWAKGYFGDGYIQLSMGEDSEIAHESFYVSAGSGVFRRKYWEKLGGMDEKLLSPFYWEDIDLCFRAAKRGYINLWEPKANVLHKHESTISSEFRKIYVQRIKERNQLLVIWKNIHSQKLMFKHLIGVFLRTVKHPGYLRIIVMALSQIGIALKSRKKEMKESKVSDGVIFSRFT